MSRSFTQGAGHGPWILLRDGGAHFYGVPPDGWSRRIDPRAVVARPLSWLVRYLGQTREPWCVAAHAWVVAQTIRSDGGSAALALAGLHHDDEEALVGDVPSPLKDCLTGLREQESKAARVTEAAWGLPAGLPWAQVKPYDLAALWAESSVLQPPKPPGLTWDPPFDARLAGIARRHVQFALDQGAAWGMGAEGLYLALHDLLLEAL